MNTLHQSILDKLRHAENLTQAQKDSILEALKEEDKTQTLLQFKLDRVEKDRYTLSVMLEESIDDLQKKNRDLEIEASLERVRSRAMGMHHSDELGDLIGIVYKELIHLDVALDRCFIILFDESGGFTWWMGSNESLNGLKGYYVKYNEHQLHLAYLKGFQERTEKWTYTLEGQEKRAWDDFIFSETDFKEFPSTVIENMKAGPAALLSASFNKFGCLMTGTFSPLEQASFEILIRFSKMFEQTYTRFLDLQKAEAQTREAQVEAALERVRSRTMAMQRSDELLDVASILFQQVKALGVPQWNCGFNIWSIGDKEFIYYPGTPDGIISPSPCKVPLTEHHIFKRFDESRRKGDDLLVYEKEGEEQADHYQYMLSLPGLGDLLQSMLDAGFELPKFQVDHLANFSYGNLIFITYKHFPEMHDVFKRFAKVFEQTYTRFLDLQKAEAQAREAQVEASLERVRGKAMAMHSSEDLAATIRAFYHELELFSITPRRRGVGLLDKETHVAELSTMNTTEQGQSIEVIGKLKLTGHPVLESIFENWLSQTEYHPVLRGNEIKEYYQLIKPQIAFPDYPNDATQYGYFFFFPEGGVYTWTEKELAEDELKIYRRFTTVLSLTYKRYKDLKDAEEGEQLAVRQSCIDRVRAEIASMRTTEDLQRITPLLWRELTALGVPFFRCGIFIVDEMNEIIHFYLSTPGGKPLAALHQRFDSSDVVKNATDHWRLQKVYIAHWDKEQFSAFAKSLLDQGQIQTANTYQGGDEPPESLTLQFMPFAQGMLYVGSADSLSELQIEVAQALAQAFSTAYARYEDFAKLESAKQQIEKTLVDLKQAQAQLVQSEKMASLGELTAGIAHEIQNPLNFVNNFSDLNRELLEEMKIEIEKGNLDEVKMLATVIGDNETKINNHGKRADVIVKGMLQHSRSSSGLKEPTDINALADEYFRLAFHGLRAKDNSFHATIKTDFDDGVESVHVVPQEIGRVVLNLLTNAFYAVNERKKLAEHAYEPIVTLRTKKVNDGVLIFVSDNGSGIPQKVLDKIFQPFFTTKPTGQGTGLGLSLSYDIVKSHGGELTVETKVGEGSEFCIQLPAAS